MLKARASVVRVDTRPDSWSPTQNAKSYQSKLSQIFRNKGLTKYQKVSQERFPFTPPGS